MHFFFLEIQLSLLNFVLATIWRQKYLNVLISENFLIKNKNTRARNLYRNYEILFYYKT